MSRAPDDIRFGSHGSVSVNYTTGQWYDHENERDAKRMESLEVTILAGLGVPDPYARM